MSAGVYTVYLVYRAPGIVQMARYVSHRGGHELPQVAMMMSGDEGGGVVTEPHGGIGMLLCQSRELTQTQQILLSQTYISLNQCMCYC